MIKIILLLTVLILFTACSEDSTIDPGVQYHDTIMPLAVDNYWVFADSTFNPPHEPVVDTTKIGITGFREITYEGEKHIVYFWNWFRMPENTPQTLKNWMRNEEEGLIYYGQQIGSWTSDVNRILFLKYPAEVGDEWAYTDAFTIRCVSTSSNFSTPLGDFDCIVYRVIPNESNRDESSILLTGSNTSVPQRDEEVRHLYFAPEFGYIGETTTVNGELKATKTLVDYNVQIPEERLSLPDRLLSP